MKKPTVPPTFLLLGALSLGLLLSCGGGPDGDPAEDARIMGQTLALAHIGKQGTISIVYPVTDLLLQDTSDAALGALRDKIRNATGIQAYDAGPILDELLRRNKRTHDLTLVSSPDDGYLVDYAGTYTKYLASGNEGDWKRMYADHKDVTAVKRVSLPAYDSEAGIALVYVRHMTLTSSGNGSIYVLGWDGTAAEELGKIVVWTP